MLGSLYIGKALLFEKGLLSLDTYWNCLKINWKAGRIFLSSNTNSDSLAMRKLYNPTSTWALAVPYSPICSSITGYLLFTTFWFEWNERFGVWIAPASSGTWRYLCLTTHVTIQWIKEGPGLQPFWLSCFSQPQNYYWDSILEIRIYINGFVYKCKIKYNFSSVSLGSTSMDSVN